MGRHASDLLRALSQQARARTRRTGRPAEIHVQPKRRGMTVTVLCHADGSETLVIACDKRAVRPPYRRTVRRWIQRMWGVDHPLGRDRILKLPGGMEAGFAPYPPESWEYSGNTVRVVAKEPPATSTAGKPAPEQTGGESE